MVATERDSSVQEQIEANTTLRVSERTQADLFLHCGERK
jgi:hypothetical protein